MDAQLESHPQDAHFQDDESCSGSPRSTSAVSEESVTGEGAGGGNRRVDHEAWGQPDYLRQALQPPAEARFKQLASLQLLRAVYQEEEEERDTNRLSVERVLQSAQRQNSAQKIRLALLQQQISNQLQIVEAQERRLAELLSHLQCLTSQQPDLSMHEGTVLQLIRDMNHVRAGNPREWPPFMAALLKGEGSLKKGDPLRSVPQIGEAFTKGYASSCHLQLSLPPLNARPVSLQEMASYSPDDVFRYLGGFKGAMTAHLQHVDSSDPQQAAQALDAIHHLADESIICQTCILVGQPSDYAVQNPWFRSTSMGSVPLDVMQEALERTRFRDEQVADIQQLWQQHRDMMASLEDGERDLREQLRGQLNQAAGLSDCQGIYLPMMETVAELEASWRAQVDCTFQWDISTIARVVDPLQMARMLASMAPYPFRFSLMLAAGLMQPTDAPL